MSDSKTEKAAREYAEKSVPFECEDSEGMYVEEVYPAQIRSVAEIAFEAGALWERERAKVLVEALRGINAEVDDDGMGGWLTDLVSNAIAEYETADE